MLHGWLSSRSGFYHAVFPSAFVVGLVSIFSRGLEGDFLLEIGPLRVLRLEDHPPIMPLGVAFGLLMRGIAAGWDIDI